MATLGTVQ